MKIVVPPNTLSEWYDLVKHTQAQTGMKLDDHIESYLILTLDSFVTGAVERELPVAVEYLESLDSKQQQSNSRLRTVGDRCLMLTGFFPERARRMNVSLSYFVNIGRQAYLTLADRTNMRVDPTLFYKLGFRFLDLTALLHTMRQLAQTNDNPENKKTC